MNTARYIIDSVCFLKKDDRPNGEKNANSLGKNGASRQSGFLANKRSSNRGYRKFNPAQNRAHLGIWRRNCDLEFDAIGRIQAVISAGPRQIAL